MWSGWAVRGTVSIPAGDREGAQTAKSSSRLLAGEHWAAPLRSQLWLWSHLQFAGRISQELCSEGCGKLELRSWRDKNTVSLLAYPGCPEAVVMPEPDGLREGWLVWTEGIVDRTVLRYSSASTATEFDFMWALPGSHCHGSAQFHAPHLVFKGMFPKTSSKAVTTWPHTESTYMDTKYVIYCEFCKDTFKQQNIHLWTFSFIHNNLLP